MLHHPFIQTIPSMKALQDLQDPHMVHLQSATFSSIRISEIMNAYKKFYPLVSSFLPQHISSTKQLQNRLSPFAVQSLTLSSLIHHLSANSPDTILAERSKRLHDMNRRVLTQMASTMKCSLRALQFLDSFQSNSGDGSKDTGKAELSLDALQTSEPNLELAIPVPENNDPPTTDLFDWFDLPLNNDLLFDGEFADLVSAQTCDIDDGQYWSLEGVVPNATPSLF